MITAFCTGWYIWQVGSLSGEASKFTLNPFAQSSIFSFLCNLSIEFVLFGYFPSSSSYVFLRCVRLLALRRNVSVFILCVYFCLSRNRSVQKVFNGFIRVAFSHISHVLYIRKISQLRGLPTESAERMKRYEVVIVLVPLNFEDFCLRCFFMD